MVLILVHCSNPLVTAFYIQILNNTFASSGNKLLLAAVLTEWTKEDKRETS